MKIFWLMMVVVLAGVLTLQSMVFKDEQGNLERYCDMVEIWESSNGTFGWPPYRGTELCN